MIRYKMIERERFGDAPFVGCLISAISCNIGCKNCFNNHVKQLKTITSNAEELIENVKGNVFEKGIILAGLEWSNQPMEMAKLINVAKNNSLEVIVYTGLDEKSFFEKVGSENIPKGTYIKFGKYLEGLKCEDNIQFGVKLASSNQYIVKF